MNSATQLTKLEVKSCSLLRHHLQLHLPLLYHKYFGRPPEVQMADCLSTEREKED